MREASGRNCDVVPSTRTAGHLWPVPSGDPPRRLGARLIAIPNTTVSVLRGSSESAYGDPEDNETVSVSGVLASLLEDNELTSTRAQDRLQQTGLWRLRVRAGTDIRLGDRIKDDRTGLIYVLNDVQEPPAWQARQDVRCSLRRVV